ncbi:uncharacterized protein LOC127239199 [Andrographis paniculata]|uniref:uncharacterized protein LOC127239199 n=1 Tax=Andrographis paniculata TaxID=175694 RepID=UPI0021E9AC34|nr:uncharacterized protein LOC127239199 [Andrographis paniculata]
MDICGAGVKLDSHYLRDFLRIGDEDRHSNFGQTASSNGSGSRSNRSGVTLLAVLTDRTGPSPPPPPDVPRRSVESSRTLLDVIREDQIGGGGGRRDGRRSWRQLRDKIRLRHRGNNHRMVIMTRRSGDPGESSQSGVTAAANVRVPILGGDSSHEAGGITSGRFEQAVAGIRRSAGAVEALAEQLPPPPVRTSLMALLAENDWQLGTDDSVYVMRDNIEEIDADEAEEDEISGSGAAYNNCCVCMERHKGAAFIPCGHTFCRLCSRELWSQRGNCPLCNNHILEVLDIF